MAGLDSTLRSSVAPSSDMSLCGKVDGAIVLVVEDDDDVREIAVEMVESSGFTVRAAPDGNTALAMLRREPDIDLMFTDIVMPGGMNGVELAEAAKHIQPALKVLFASGFADPAVLAPLTEFGFAFIRKPYHLDEVARRIRRLMAE